MTSWGVGSNLRSCRRTSFEARRREAGRARSWTCCSLRGAQRWEGRRSSPLRCSTFSDRRRDRFASGSPITPPRLWKVQPHRVDLRTVRHRTKVTKGPGIVPQYLMPFSAAPSRTRCSPNCRQSPSPDGMIVNCGQVHDRAGANVWSREDGRLEFTFASLCLMAFRPHAPRHPKPGRPANPALPPCPDPSNPQLFRSTACAMDPGSVMAR